MSWWKQGYKLCFNQIRLGRLPISFLFRSSSSSRTLIDNPEVIRFLNLIEKQHEVKVENSSSLEPIIHLIQLRKVYQNDLENLAAMKDENDQDMKKLILEEKELFIKKLGELNEEIINTITPNVDEDRDVILEVTAGVGGKEAMLFAGELFSMYSQYAAYKNWDWQPAEVDTSEGGGVRHSSALVSGRLAFHLLSQEVGIHRVQRVPVTEKSGRIHTSTAAVSLLIQPSDVEVVLNDKDLKFETKTSSGAGGQHVNKTESCVRITHIPTGVIIENQTDRSQIQNKKIALQRLRTKLYQMQLEQQASKSRATKKEQIGSSLRSEKVRTYNFNQDRVTDHRVGVSLHNLEGFLSGSGQLDDLIALLLKQRRERDLLEYVAEQLASRNIS